MSRAKARKMKKYADEDEEEREIRMMLVGCKKQQPQTTTGQQQQQPVTEAKESQTTTTTPPATEAPKNACFICGSTAHYARDCPKRKDENALTAASAGAEDEDETASKGDEDKKTSSELDRLTGQPRADDVLLYAVPVCAPYDALKNFKYKVKLTPGRMKCLRAVQSALALFTKQSDSTAQERRLMQAVPEAELMQVMPSDVMVAGGQANARPPKRSPGRR